MSRYQISEKEVEKIHSNIEKLLVENNIDKRDITIDISETSEITFTDNHTGLYTEIKPRRISNKDAFIDEISNEIFSDIRAIVRNNVYDNVTKYACRIYDVLDTGRNGDTCWIIRYSKSVNFSNVKKDG